MLRKLFILFSAAVCSSQAISQNWKALGTGISNYDVRDLLNDSLNNLLYAGGNFCSANGILSRSVATWNGSSWDTLNPQYNSCSSLPIFSTFAKYGDSIFAGGSLRISGHYINPVAIAKWN